MLFDKSFTFSLSTAELLDRLEKIYDVVIIGSGMGGLACANILAREGLSVIVLEKNLQIGGNLQIFARDKCIFDTGVHYLGGLDEGQNLRQLFRYFGIFDELSLKRLDEDSYDRIHFYKEGKYYRYGMGYERFVENLVADFPDERAAIEAYATSIRSVAQNLPLAQLKASQDDAIPEIDFSLNASRFIESLTNNQQLRKVMGGTNTLYAGSTKTPFFVHALVLNSYIESSWRCVDGGAQIAQLMVKRITENGGVVLNRSEARSGEMNEDGTLAGIHLANGKVVRGKNFISNVHPQETIRFVGEKNFSRNFAARIKRLTNTGSMFVLHVVFHKDTFEYFNYNIFQANLENIWNLYEYSEDTWPSYYMISCPPNSRSDKYADGISVICGMGMDELKPWTDTFNTTARAAERGADYDEFKRVRSEKVIDAISFHFPDIRSKIKSYYSSTPLTQRDYLASPDGSGYGIEKDSDAAFRTLLSPKTSIPNLYLTGQNLNLHGILGVSLSALLTCFNLVDRHALMVKINAAKPRK